MPTVWIELPAQYGLEKRREEAKTREEEEKEGEEALGEEIVAGGVMNVVTSVRASAFQMYYYYLHNKYNILLLQSYVLIYV